MKLKVILFSTILCLCSIRPVHSYSRFLREKPFPSFEQVIQTWDRDLLRYEWAGLRSGGTTFYSDNSRLSKRARRRRMKTIVRELKRRERLDVCDGAFE